MISAPRRSNIRLVSGVRAYGPLEHYDYAVLDEHCVCRICADWRLRKTEYFATVREAMSGHPRSCRCTQCRKLMRCRSAYLAAMNRRDLYSESSFHAVQSVYESAADASLHINGRGIGPKFMEWLEGQLYTKNNSWWEGKAPYLALNKWFRAYFESGIVEQELKPASSMLLQGH